MEPQPSPPESLANAASRLISLINYQIFTPRYTTMGLCPHCRQPSRGAGRCYRCLTRDLSEVVGSKAAERYTAKALDLAEMRDEVYRLAGDDENEYA